MSKFKVGDKVKLSPDAEDYCSVKRDTEYTVSGIHEVNSARFSILENPRWRFSYNERDFQLFKEPKIVYAIETSNFHGITKGSAYAVLEECDGGYLVITDFGKTIWILKDRFTTENPACNCYNCGHAKKQARDYPCSKCTRNFGAEDHWIKAAHDKIQGFPTERYATHIDAKWVGNASGDKIAECIQNLFKELVKVTESCERTSSFEVIVERIRELLKLEDELNEHRN